MVSIIAVINNNEIYEKGLKKSLLFQKTDNYQLIEIDNTKGQYKRMKEALEVGINRAAHEWIIFMHPDIFMLNDNELESILLRVKKISEKDINIKLFGVAGLTEGKNGRKVSTIVHGANKKDCGEKEVFTKQGFVYAQTIDACCFIIKKSTIEQYGFWEKLNGYHMYVEELCLRLQRDGKKVAVIAADLWHFSQGASLDYTYYRETMKVITRYKDLDYINTTSFKWKVNVGVYIKVFFYMIRNFVHHRVLKA